MHLLVWSAARRLALLVAGSLVFVAVPFVVCRHIGMLAAISGAGAVTLLATSLVPLFLAQRALRRADRGIAGAEVYRTSARPPDRDASERAAVHGAAIALMLVSMAAALTVVAAASR